MLCLLAAAASLTAPVFAQNVSVTDYKVPVSRADNLRIDVLSLNYVVEGGEEVVKSGNLGVVYKKFYESLPSAYRIDMRGAASFNKDSSRDKLVGDFRTTVVAEVQKYRRAEGNLFIFGGTDLDLDDDFDRPGVDITVGIGYGRFINATALRKAVRIEDFFLKEGVSVISGRIHRFLNRPGTCPSEKVHVGACFIIRSRTSGPTKRLLADNGSRCSVYPHVAI